MRLLFLGDIVGQPGVRATLRGVPALIESEAIDLVVANAENASGGAGMSPRIYRELRGAGVDVVTMGDHIYKRKEIIRVMTADALICKPANFPPDAPGREFAVAVARDGTHVGVFSLLGRTFMRPVDCPFRAADRVLEQLQDVRCILVDVHAEATGEKALLGRYLDGKVSAVVGTHTHVPTADEQLLPQGTAFLTDAGMTGPYDSILGRRVDRLMKTTVTFVPTPFDVAEGDVRLSGAIVDIDAESGRAVDIRRIMLRESELPSDTRDKK